MEVKILQLYPDCMSLYGEYGNVAVLRRHLEALDVQVAVEQILLEDVPVFSEADVIYMGCGTEGAQKAALSALIPHAPALKEAVARGAVVLFTGNAMELLGAKITDTDARQWPGLGLAGFESVESEKRDPEDVIACTTLWDSPVVGFMNKCTTTSGVTSPLFEGLKLGLGNEKKLGPEGYVEGNLFATHITGPVLVKNPEFTDLLLARIFALKGWQAPDTWPVLPYEREAYDVTLRELSARVKENGA